MSPRMHGRVEEMLRIARVLRQARLSPGGLLMVEGEAGTGKTLLLDRTEATAADLGYVTLRLIDEPAPVAAPPPTPSGVSHAMAVGATLPGAQEAHLWWIDRLQHRIMANVAIAPVLFTLDDLHELPAEWLSAVTTLVRRLSDERVVWAMSRRIGAGGASVDRLYRLSGVHRELLPLGPLPPAAIADLVADLIQQEPATDLLDAVAAARGNPFFVVELVEGLREEGRLTLGCRHRQVVPGGLPHRVRASVQQQISALSPSCRHLMQVASVMENRFALDRVAQLMNISTASLLPALEEGIRSGLLVSVDDQAVFSHDLLRRIVQESIPRSLLNALRREVALVLVARAHDGPLGSSLADHPVPTPGIPVPRRSTAFDGRPHTPDAQVNPGPPHPLTAWHLDEAVRLVSAEPATSQSPATSAQRQSHLSHLLVMRGEIERGKITAEQVLALPELPDEIRADATAARLLALSMCDPAETGRMARTVLSEHARVDGHGPLGASVVFAETVLSNLLWESGQLIEGLRHNRRAVRAIDTSLPAPWRAHVRLSLARKLTNLRHIDDAEAIIQETQREIEHFGLTLQAPAPIVSRARLLMQAGRLTESRTEAQRSVTAARERGVRLLMPLAYSVLATVALRTGDLLTAADYVKRYRSGIAPGTVPLWSLQYDWVELLLVAGQDGPRGVAEVITRRCPALPGNPSLYVEEPGAAPWLVRLAHAIGDRDLGLTVVSVAERLAATNPTVSAVQAGALHARGLFDEDPLLLARAAAEHADPWARGWAYEDLGNYLLRRNRDTGGAVTQFENALSRFEQVGAARDVTRVRARLRSFGVHRRGVEPTRQGSSGWASLSEIERTIAHLVNQGLTNRQIAQRVFLSPHTVNYHLRQIFRKLSIGSRVELARLTQEHYLANREPPVLPEARYPPGHLSG